MNFLSDPGLGGEPQRRILVVEDSSDDLFFLQRALDKSKTPIPIDVVTDGIQAHAYLNRALQQARPDAIPCLIFLDLKLPGRNGFDILEWMRLHPAFGDTLKVILTGSQEERDVTRAFELGADAYVPKPIELEDLQAVLAALASGSWRPATGGGSAGLPGLKRAAA